MHILLRKLHGRFGAVFSSGQVTFEPSPSYSAAAPLLLPGSLGLSVIALLVMALVAVVLAIAPASSATVAHADPVSLIGFAVVGNVVDIYSTQSTMGVVTSLKRKISGFAKMFFPRTETSTSEIITFEIDERKNYLAPYVHADIPARMRGNKGRRQASFSPAYVKELQAIRPSATLKRASGESFETPLTPETRAAAILGGIIEEQVDYIDNRVEQMAVEAIVTGKVVVTGEGYETSTVNFGRDSDLDRAQNILTGTARWGQSAANPLKDLRRWNRLMVQKSGSPIQHVILDADSADAFLDDAKVEAKLNVLNVNIGVLELMQAQEAGLQFLGRIEGKMIWQYCGWYLNEAGTELEVFSGGDVVCIGAVDGVQAYGAIQDMESLIAVPVFTKTYEERNPSMRMVLTQSAPLPVPQRINATLVASVITGT